MITLGAILRTIWIFGAHPWDSVEEFQKLYVYSDMLQYWNGARTMWHPPAIWHSVDTLYPPGMAWFLALLLGPQMDRVFLFQVVQWILAILLMPMSALLAYVHFGRRAAYIALGISAIAFPLFDYSAYVIAETPFTFLVTAGVLMLSFGLKKKHMFCIALAGIFFGLSATFKSVGLIVGVFAAFSFLHWRWKVTPIYRYSAAALFVFCIALAITPASLEMTKRNHGKFLLLSNDVFRMALANHGDLLGASVKFPDGGGYVIHNPVALQKSMTDMRNIPWNTDQVLQENLTWAGNHPKAAAHGVLVRMVDMIYGTVPFPTSGTNFWKLAALSQKLMLALVYVPALAYLLFGIKNQKNFLLLCLPLILPIVGLFMTSIIAATEPRYLHPFTPLLIALASPLYVKIRLPVWHRKNMFMRMKKRIVLSIVNVRF